MVQSTVPSRAAAHHINAGDGLSSARCLPGSPPAAIWGHLLASLHHLRKALLPAQESIQIAAGGSPYRCQYDAVRLPGGFSSAARRTSGALAGRDGGGERWDSGGLAPRLCIWPGKGRAFGEAAAASCCNFCTRRWHNKQGRKQVGRSGMRDAQARVECTLFKHI